MKKAHFTKRALLVITPIVLVLLISAVLLWTVFGKIDLEGTVVSPEGEPLKGLEITLFDTNGDHTVIAEGVTNAKGRFRLRFKDVDDENEIDEAVLQVSGNEGAGRVRLTELQETDMVEVEYPILETIVLLHDNDLHFNFNQADLFKEKINEIRQSYDDVYLLSAGDIFVRNRKEFIDYDGDREDDDWYSERCGFMIDLMNEIGYDVMTAGNHELEMIEERTGEALRKAEFPILGANVEVTTELMPSFLPYVALTTSTLRNITVLGITHGVTGDVGHELDWYDTAEDYLYLNEQSDIFIALTHIGVNGDIEMANRFPEFDVIIGGDSHTLIEEGEMINSVLVAQAGGNEKALSLEYPKYLGEIILTLENGRIVNKEAHVFQFNAPLHEPFTVAP
jgi:2',3'-cyclic-nucleotide 2'-phosphodiesterase (5'-nucleotidase family)